MPTTYCIADADVKNLLIRTMSRYFPRLANAGVRVGVLMAHSEDGPALKHVGYGVLACIKPVSLKDRLTKGYDAELLIDGAQFGELRPRQQESLIHHELSHIDTIDLTPKEMQAREGDLTVTWKVDDLSRPRLTSVPGDWASSDGFAATVREFGDDAIEYDSLDRCRSKADAARDAGQERDL